MSLKKVTIGPYIPNQNGVTSVNITSKSLNGTAGSLRDPAMGFVMKKGETRMEKNLATAIGKDGQITFSEDILNPIMRNVMLVYLSLFKYDTAGDKLVMKADLMPLIERYKDLSGMRKLEHISRTSSSSNSWKRVKERLDVVVWNPNEKTKIEVRGSKLKKLLENATLDYRRGGRLNSPVSIEDFGIDLSVSRPEQFISGTVPVLPNIFRMGSVYQQTHPYDTLYTQLIIAKMNNDSGEFADAYMQLVKKNKTGNLVEDVFSAEKTGFIRGSMYSKVGGQIGRSVVSPNPAMRPDQVGVPRSMAKELNRRMLVVKTNKEDVEKVRALLEEGKITHIFDDKAKEFVPIRKEHIASIGKRNVLLLRELGDDDLAIQGRQPSLHKNSMLGLRVKLHDGKTIETHPSLTSGFAMD